MGAVTYEKPAAPSQVDRAALALRWAPVHYQDVATTGRHALGGAADYIAAYDFDGDLDARNNWENAGTGDYPLAGHAYYSVVETGTHWFITYTFFHPRDWVGYVFDSEHENDAEGLLVSVARDGTRFGALKAVVTVAHAHFYSYVPAGSDWRSGSETVDGILELAELDGELHPVTAQESQGHGLKARPQYDIREQGVVYYPSLTTAEVPEGPDDRHVLYRLVDVFEPNGLWANRRNPALFATPTSFAGDTGGACGARALYCGENSANPPWAWDDRDDRVPRGSLAMDPALLVRSYFAIPERVASAYAVNPFR